MAHFVPRHQKMFVNMLFTRVSIPEAKTRLINCYMLYEQRTMIGLHDTIELNKKYEIDIAFASSLKNAIIRTRKWPIQCRIRVIEDVDQGFQTCVQPANVEEKRQPQDRVIHYCQCDLSPVGKLNLPVEMEPHDTCQPEGEP